MPARTARAAAVRAFARVVAIGRRRCARMRSRPTAFRRARRSVQGALGWRPNDAWQVGADLLATSPRKDSGFSADYIPGYVLVNLSAEWRPAPAWTVAARLENALDADYETALGFAQAGRSLFVRLQWANW